MSITGVSRYHIMVRNPISLISAASPMENMMIPNGAYYDNSKKKSKNQRTSMQYGGLFYINDAHMYCSNCDCCDSYENGCSCREYDVISPSYYKDI